jgi:GGDEF domain-containing protein
LEKELFEVIRFLKTQHERDQPFESATSEQVIRDPLTGLFHRRYLNETLQYEIASVKREGHPLSVLMIDIDLLKGLTILMVMSTAMLY